MKLRGIIITLALAITANLTATAQDDYSSEECKKFRSLYYQYLKQGMYEDACLFWTKAYNTCGGVADSVDGKFFKNARVAYSKRLKGADKSDTTLIKNLKDSIAFIYEQRMLIEDDPKWRLDYAVMLVSDKDKRFGKIDSLFEAIHVLKDGASSTHLKSYFRHLIINKFNKASQEEKEVVRGNVIEEYIVLSDYVGTAIKKAGGMTDTVKSAKSIKRYDSAQTFLDKYFLKIANDCTVLTPVLDKKFENLPEDKDARLAQVNKFVGLLEKQNCTDSDTYAKFVQESVDINPTAPGYFGLGTVQKNKGDARGAVESFKKAVEYEGEGDNKDKYLLAVASAQYKAKQYKAAFGTAKQVQGEGRGDAMMICGNSIAALANSCGESTFERKANYWLANDYYRKAASLGANASTGKFLSSAPTSEDCFSESVSMGSSFTLSCWGESTTVR